MFGAFRPTNALSGGLLWKIPWRLSKFQKARQRKRLRAVDSVVATLDKALAKQSITTKAVERWKGEMPVEQEMVPKDKYTIFDRKEKKYRKSIRSEHPPELVGARNYTDWVLELPKWTRVSQRINPPGY
ncbi:54S ribosomal protein L31, mitochondrial [Venustampulla echinocandica]|uniref:54S ribosomal protein L31, mitochondrial n=1 Tax=Venustampulla echinocandica TaxID=2656787 RepID=A0A370TGM8_9HELO|nr:54S ribosomal protein L31, mitochondrial [Venustampulla echinocandica]RDL34354.1 54S ribosomal protein L31, mitochondrial [Venustampulla echinocandica]